MIIKKIESEDIQNIYEMNEEFNEVGATTIEQMHKSLEDIPNEIVLIAYENDNAAGFICGKIHRSICYKDPAGEITEMYVRENYRRQGIAKALIAELEKVFASNGISEITLLTGSDNIGAQKFYESCGYSGDKESFYEKFI